MKEKVHLDHQNSSLVLLGLTISVLIWLDTPRKDFVAVSELNPDLGVRSKVDELVGICHSIH